MEQYITEDQSLYMPTVCPVCGAKLVWKGVQIMCPNPECSDSAVQDVLIWMNNVVPTDGLGDAIRLSFLTDLLGSDNISVEAIYEHDIAESLPTYTATYNKCVETFNRMFSDEVSLTNAILALNIPRFGTITAAKLAEYPEIVKKLSEGELVECADQIGLANFESIKENLSKFSRLKFLNIKYDQPASSGQSVAITGQLSMKRALFEEILKNHGYIPSSSVTKNTFALITNDPGSGSSKNQSAQKFGIPIYTELEFTSKFLN